MCMYVYMYVCIYMYVYMCVCINVCNYGCMYVCVYMYVCMHVYMCVFMYVCKEFKYHSSLLSIFNCLLNVKLLNLCFHVSSWDTDFIKNKVL